MNELLKSGYSCREIDAMGKPEFEELGLRFQQMVAYAVVQDQYNLAKQIENDSTLSGFCDLKLKKLNPYQICAFSCLADIRVEKIVAYATKFMPDFHDNTEETVKPDL